MFFEGKEVRVHHARLEALKGITLGLDQGMIVSSGGPPLLGVSDGSVALEVVQGEGKRRMSGEDWWRGLQLGPDPVPVETLGR